MLVLEFTDDHTQSVIDEVQFERKTQVGSAEDIHISAIYVGSVSAEGDRSMLELLAHTHSLIIEPEQGGNADVHFAGVVEAVDLIENGPNVEQVIALDIAEVGGPTVVDGVIDQGDRIGSGELRKRDGIGVDFGAIEIVDAVSAGTIRPFVAGVLVGPSGVAAVILHNFEYRVGAKVLVGQIGAQRLFGSRGRKLGLMPPPPSSLVKSKSSDSS